MVAPVLRRDDVDRVLLGHRERRVDRRLLERRQRAGERGVQPVGIDRHVERVPDDLRPHRARELVGRHAHRCLPGQQGDAAPEQRAGAPRPRHRPRRRRAAG